MKTKNKFVMSLLAATGITIMLSASACTSSATSNDQTATNRQLSTFEASQPIPFNQWSQYRQTLIDVEQAEVHGVATTSFFFNQGVQNPVKSCPSIGYPVPSTSQLTNPEQVVNGPGSGNVTIGQAEPNGSYTGSSDGTYVVCVSSDGSKRPDYWEGKVETEGGAAHYDRASGLIVDDGGTTVTTKTGK